MEVIYLTNAITAKQKNELETLLMPFPIMSRKMFVGQCALIIAGEAENGPAFITIKKTFEPHVGHRTSNYTFILLQTWS